MYDEAANNHTSDTIQAILAQVPGVVYQLKQDTLQSSIWLSYISNNCQRLFGHSQAQMQANERLFMDCIHPSDQVTLLTTLETSRQTLAPCLWTGRIIQPSGNVQWVHSTAQPCQGTQQEILWNGLLILVLPTTPEIKRQDEQYRVAPDQLKHHSTSSGVSVVPANVPPSLSSPSLPPSALPDSSTIIPAADLPSAYFWQQAHQVLEHEVAERTSQLNQTIELLLDEVIERNQAEQGLRDRDAFLRSIYNNVHQFIFVVDIDESGGIQFAELNPACESAFGITSSLARGKTPEEVLGHRAGLLLRQQCQQCISQGTASVYEESVHIPSGPTWWLTQLTPLRRKNGAIYSIIGNAIDISHQKQVEQALKKRDRLLQGAAIAHRHLLTQPNLQQAIQSALSVIGAAAGLHHIYILERLERSHPSGNSASASEAMPQWDMQVFCEWGASGTSTQAMSHPTRSADVGREEWYATLALGDTMMGSVDMFPDPIRTYLTHHGVQFVLVEPIIIENQTWGCIGFEDCASNQEWPASERSIFRTTAENIAGAIARHYIESELEESTQILQLIMDNIPQAIFWKDRNSVYIGCNATFARAAGLNKTDEIVDKTDHDLCWTSEEAELYRQNDQYVMTTDTALYHVIEPQRQSNGDEILCDVNKIPLHDQDGDVVGILGTFEDITERQKAEDALRESEAKYRHQTRELQITLQELQQTQAQLIQSEKMSSLGQLVAGVAHEINNPVNFIYGNVNHARNYASDLIQLLELYEHHGVSVPPTIQAEIEALELDFLKDDFPKLLDSMKVGAVRIRDIVSSLRTFSRMDEAERKTVNIHDGLDSTLMILQSRLKPYAKLPQGINVNRRYGNIPNIDCFAGALNQVFMNLISNAIDALEDALEFYQEQQVAFQPQLTICTQLEVATSSHSSSASPNSTAPTEADPLTGSKPSPQPSLQNNAQLSVSITDNALGIPQHIQPRLFDPFFTTKPVGQGTGMGLSISYQIITERHGGTLAFQSSHGQGTTFTLKIPVHGLD